MSCAGGRSSPKTFARSHSQEVADKIKELALLFVSKEESSKPSVSRNITGAGSVSSDASSGEGGTSRANNEDTPDIYSAFPETQAVQTRVSVKDDFRVASFSSLAPLWCALPPGGNPSPETPSEPHNEHSKEEGLQEKYPLCCPCGQQFEGWQSYIEHIPNDCTKSKRARFFKSCNICVHCGAKVPKFAYQIHIKKHLDKLRRKDLRLLCPFCVASFLKQKQLERHIVECHRIPKEDTTERSAFTSESGNQPPLTDATQNASNTSQEVSVISEKLSQSDESSENKQTFTAEGTNSSLPTDTGAKLPECGIVKQEVSTTTGGPTTVGASECNGSKDHLKLSSAMLTNALPAVINRTKPSELTNLNPASDTTNTRPVSEQHLGSTTGGLASVKAEESQGLIDQRISPATIDNSLSAPVICAKSPEFSTQPLFVSTFRPIAKQELGASNEGLTSIGTLKAHGTTENQGTCSAIVINTLQAAVTRTKSPELSIPSQVVGATYIRSTIKQEFDTNNEGLSYVRAFKTHEATENQDLTCSKLITKQEVGASTDEIASAGASGNQVTPSVVVSNTSYSAEARPDSTELKNLSSGSVSTCISPIKKQKLSASPGELTSVSISAICVTPGNSTNLAAHDGTVMPPAEDQPEQARRTEMPGCCYVPKCLHPFMSWEAYVTHYNSKHSNAPRCPLCLVVFTPSHIEKHMIESNNYKCQRCPAKFLSKEHLIAHRKLYHLI